MAGRLAIEGGEPIRRELLPYGTQWIDDADEEALRTALRSGWLTGGPAVRAFEEKLAAAAGARFAVAVSSGTAALHAAAHVAGVRGKRLVTSPLSFVASANCALYAGGEAAFADVDQATGCMAPDRLEAALATPARVVVPVHLCGNPADMAALAAKAGPDTLIVEDAAHALGATYDGAPVGSCRHGHMAIFSFHPVKLVTTGEGGAVVTNDEELARGLRRFRDHGIERTPAPGASWDGPWSYELVELGYNYRITDLQCALGSTQLDRLPAFIHRRRELAAYYTRALSNDDRIVLPRETPGAQSAWHLYVIRLRLDRLSAGRREVFEALRAEGIGVQVHYIPIHLQPMYRDRYGLRAGDFPAAESFYAGAISIPLFPRMSDDDARDVVRALEKVLARYAR